MERKLTKEKFIRNRWIHIRRIFFLTYIVEGHSILPYILTKLLPSKSISPKDWRLGNKLKHEQHEKKPAEEEEGAAGGGGGMNE